MTDLRITHIGGPTVLIEVHGWRLLTDPTFDPPGRNYDFGWGTGSQKLTGPSVAASDLGPIDAVLLTHDHHDDNLDSCGRELLPSAGAVVTTVELCRLVNPRTAILRPLRGLEAFPARSGGDRARVRTRARGHSATHPLAVRRSGRGDGCVARYSPYR